MKNKLIIFFLRIKKFVINNKIAVGIVILLLITSLIIYKVVFAADDPYADKISISSAAITEENGILTGVDFDEAGDTGCALITNPGCDGSATNSRVRTFDTFDINLSYSTTDDSEAAEEAIERKIVYVVDFPSNVIVRPLMLNNDMTYTYDSGTNKFSIKDLKQLQYTEDNHTTNETQTLKFQVGGNANETDITPESIEIYESTKDTEADSSIIDDITDESVVVTSKVSIEAKLVSSYAFKATTNRTVPFGILVKLVGIGKTEKGIKGATYPADFVIDINAERTVEPEAGTTLLYDSNSAEIYDASTEIFDMPNGIITNEFDSSVAVYNSGAIAEDPVDRSILTISNISSNGIFPQKYGDEENIIGTYYGEFLSTRAVGDDVDYVVEISAEGEEVPEEGVSINATTVSVNDRYVADGFHGDGEDASTITSLTLNDADNIDQIQSIYDKEILTINVSSTYGKSGDEISAGKIRQDIVVPSDITFIPYEENVGDDGYFVFESNANDIEKGDFNITLYASGDEILDAGDTSYDDFDSFLEATKPVGTEYYFVVFEMNTAEKINPDTSLDFSIKGLLERASSSATYFFATAFDIKVNSDYIFTNEAEEKEIVSEEGIFYTTFKARTDLELKDSNGNTDFSSSYSEPLVWSVSPIVTSYYLDYLELDEISLDIYISPGLTYKENIENLEPGDKGTQSGGTYNGYYHLEYTLTGHKVNEYINQIYIDTSINLDATSSQRVVAVINATAGETTKITDESSVAERTTIKQINIFGSSSVMFRQLVGDPVVIYSESMDIDYTTEINNGTASDIDELSVINILPYNGDSISNYAGSYYLSAFPVGAECTNTAVNSDFIINIDTYDDWYACSDNVEEDDKKEVTAFKSTGTLPAPNPENDDNFATFNFTLNADDAENGDIFATTAYVKYASIYERTNTVSSVISSIRLLGKVWEDFSYDGERDTNERELGDIVLKLYDSSDELIDETTSDSSGNYAFNALQVGKTYYVKASYDTEKYFPTKISESTLPTYKSVFSSQTEGEETFAVSPEYEITEATSGVDNVNLGLALKKTFALSINKYITQVVVKTNLLADQVYDFDKQKTVKIDVKDMNKVSIKVLYTLELENIKYYPGYAKEIIDYIPTGMAFNESYEENEGWEIDDNGFLVNRTLSEEIIYGGDKKYLTVAFDITSKEAGEFVNSVSIYDLQPLSLGTE